MWPGVGCVLSAWNPHKIRQNPAKYGKFGEFWQNLRAEVAAAFLLLFFLQGIWAIIVTNSYGDPNTTAVDHSDLSFWLQGLLHNTPEPQGYYLSSLILNGSYEPLSLEDNC